MPLPLMLLVLLELLQSNCCAIFPLLISTVGIIASVIIGVMCVRGSANVNPAKSLNIWNLHVSSAIVIIGSLVLSNKLLGSLTYAYAIIMNTGQVLWNHHRSLYLDSYRFVKKIAEQSQTGSATTIISGFRC